MHHMCDVSPSVDMFTYCGDDWYNDMCGDVCMSIWISTYCGDVCNMEIVWVGGGMVNVMSCPLTPRQSWHLASRFWYPPHCHWRTYTSFHKVIVFGRLQAKIAQGLHDCDYCANVQAASCARAHLLDLVPPRRARRGASCGFAWPMVRHTSRRGLDHKNWIFWIWPLSPIFSSLKLLDDQT